ncbi:MAG: hypothetical protein OEU36_06915, partial [Gammaproteobacteria bacterium]|nr:hypothetical protein [Gammaproteobacteria bacterium]
MNAGLKTFLLSVVVFSISFFYFYNTSELLPIGAGPDYTAHNDAVDFIYQNSRLPILPDDEEALRYTVYGSTRAL